MKRIKIYLISGIILSGLFLSCSTKRAEVNVYEVETSETLDFTTPVDAVTSAELNSIHYLPLKGSEDHFLAKSRR